MEDLETAIAEADPGSFMRFRASSITSALGERILALKRCMDEGFSDETDRKQKRPPKLGSEKRWKTIISQSDRGGFEK
jgi:hypothetical protein